MGIFMVMKMFDVVGVDMMIDGECIVDEDNFKGYFEDECVKDFENMIDCIWVCDLCGKVIKVIFFFFKFLLVDNNYKVIFMCCDFDEVFVF